MNLSKYSHSYVTKNNNYLSLFIQNNGFYAGVYHNRHEIFKFASPNEIAWAEDNWAKEAVILDMIVSFDWLSPINEGYVSNDITENYIKVKVFDIDYERFLGYNDDYGWANDDLTLYDDLC